MLLLPAYLVAIITALAGVAWIVFARSQAGRFQSKVLPWLSLPFFFVAGLYTWFTFVPVEISVRAIHARYAIMSISLPQVIILFVLSLYNNRGAHGK